MHKTRFGNHAAKETRLNVREAPSQFVADETQFLLTPVQFKQFCQALDAPPARNLKAMQKLLREPSVLDGLNP